MNELLNSRLFRDPCNSPRPLVIYIVHGKKSTKQRNDSLTRSECERRVLLEARLRSIHTDRLRHHYRNKVTLTGNMDMHHILQISVPIRKTHRHYSDGDGVVLPEQAFTCAIKATVFRTMGSMQPIYT